MARQFRGIKWAGKNKWQTASDGSRFPSKRECQRWEYHLDRQQRGIISALARQVTFDLAVTSVVTGLPVTICRYSADFAFIENATGEYVVEDSKPKGMVTTEYEIKERLVLALHGVTIRRV